MPADSMMLKAVLKFDVGNAMANMGKASVGFTRMQSQANRLKGGVAQVGGAVGKMALGFAPLTFGLVMATNKAREFGRGVAEVTTIADEAEFPISKIENTTLELAKTYGTVPVEQTKAMYQAISAGATTAAEATEVLNVANKLAVGGVSDVFTSIDVLTTAVNSYAAAGLEAADASDIIFTTVRLGKTTVDELGAGLGQVIPAAADLKVSFAELGAAMATITAGGISTAEASTAVNAALMNIRKPSEEARKAAERLGIDFSATALKKKDLVTVLGEATEAAKGDDEAITALFGSVRALKAISVLTTNEGKKFNEALAEMEERAGATEIAFQKMTETSDFQMKKFMAMRVAAETLFGQILEGGLLKMLSPLADVTEGIVNILEAVKTGEFDELSGSARDAAMGIRDAMDSISSGIDWVIQSLGSAKQWFVDTFGEGSMRDIAKFATIFLVVAGAAAPLLLALGGIGFILSSVISLVVGVGTIIGSVFGMLLGPIGIVIAVIVLFREQLWGIFEGLMEVAGPVFDSLKEIFLDTVNTIVEVFNGLGLMWTETTGGMSADWKEVGRVIGAIIGGIVTAFAHIASFGIKVTAWLLAGFVRLGVGLGEFFGQLVEFVMNPLRSIAKGVVGFIEMTGATAPATLVAYAGGPDVRVSARGLGGEKARGLGERVKRFGVAEAAGAAKEKLAAEESKGALAVALDEITAAANNTADSAQSAAEAAKKKPCAKVNLDGREVARSNAKAEDEIRARSGKGATPWQRNQVVVHGARPV